MREGESTGDYIWLRQSATFTANGQTRTLEIAIPVRPDATPAEVEALLAQAQAGMAQLTQALDTRVLAALSPQSAPLAAPAPRVAARQDHAEHEAPQPPAPAVPEPGSARPAGAETARPAVARPPTPAAPAATRPAAPAPAASQPRPATSGQDLSRPEFLAAVAQLGLKPKDAMDRLGVRTLEGLNLREALESLRRQMLRSSVAPAAPASSAPSASSAPAPATPARTPPARAEASRAEAIASAPHPPHPFASVRAPVQFDEEEDADFTFTVDEEGVLRDAKELDEADEDDAAVGMPGMPGEPEYASGELDDLDLDDVPDFGPPPGRAGPPAASSRAPARVASPRASAAPSTAPSSSATSASAGKTAARGVGEAKARAQELIKQMRSSSAGGTSSAQQRTAYRNIILTEIGEASARALIQGLWRVTPERLGPDQYDELISWGKQDTFADEVPRVLAALDAERQAAREQASGEAEASGDASRPTPPAAPPTPRSRPGASGTSRGDR